MIVGASRMTYYLVKELQDIQKRVTVIDSDAARCQEMSEKFPGVLVIHGDGADAELLSEERITDMDAFVALTGLDETNIILAMYASQINSCKVVAKINRESFAELAAAKGWWTASSPRRRSRRSPLPCTSAPCRTALSRRTSRRCTVWWAGAGGAGIQRCAGFAVHRRTAEGSDPAQAAGGGHRAAMARRSSRPATMPAGGRRCRHRHHRHNAAPLRATL